jgi:hypothetical protein
VNRDAEGKSGEAAPEEAGPHGITLAAHASISAEIAEGAAPLQAVLARHEIAESAWNEATIHWLKRIGDETLERRESARLPLVYSEAFSKAQDALKPLPPMTASEYATLVAAIQAEGAVDRPLAARGLSTADYLRLSRHWAGVLARDPAHARAYFETLESLQPKG